MEREVAARERERLREASTVEDLRVGQLQARIDADAQLAFNADLLAFANRLQVDPPARPRPHVTPARGNVSPVRKGACDF